MKQKKNENYLRRGEYTMRSENATEFMRKWCIRCEMQQIDGTRSTNLM